MPDSIPTVDLLVQVRPERPDSVLLVARSGFGRNTHLGAMSAEDLLKTARLFVAAAVGEDAAKFILDCVEVGAESAAEGHAAADAAFRLVQAWTPPVEAVTS